MIEQVTIIGTGLIGGSLGMALRDQGIRVTGCDRQPVLEKALELRAIDRGSADAFEACEGSQVVVLATPVGGIIDLLEQLGPLLPHDMLITDVGSTKAQVCDRAKAIFGEAVNDRFLGGHPMAGKEHSGVEYADGKLFYGAAWIFIGEGKRNGLAGEWMELIRRLGTRVLRMKPDAHDELVGWTSHLPQMMATAMASTLLEEVHNSELHAVGGRALREMTRIAASPYSMWRDIAFTNTANIEKALLKLEQRLAHLRENLRSPELRAEFDRAHKFKGE